jgi:hypothetical protein
VLAVSLAYTTLHYTTLHYTTLHYTTLHCATLLYTTPHYATLLYTTLHYSSHSLWISCARCCITHSHHPVASLRRNSPAHYAQHKLSILGYLHVGNLSVQRCSYFGQVTDRDAENHQLSKYLPLLDCLSPLRSSCPDSLPPITSIPLSSISPSPSSLSSVRHRLQVRPCWALHNHTKTVNAGPALTCKRGCKLGTVSSGL